MKFIRETLPLISLLAVLVKIIIIPPTIPDAIIFGFAVVFMALDQLRLKDTKLKEYDDIIFEVKDQYHRQQALLEQLQGSTNSVKVAMAMRPAQGKKY